MVTIPTPSLIWALATGILVVCCCRLVVCKQDYLSYENHIQEKKLLTQAIFIQTAPSPLLQVYYIDGNPMHHFHTSSVSRDEKLDSAATGRVSRVRAEFLFHLPAFRFSALREGYQVQCVHTDTNGNKVLGIGANTEILVTAATSKDAIDLRNYMFMIKKFLLFIEHTETDCAFKGLTSIFIKKSVQMKNATCVSLKGSVESYNPTKVIHSKFIIRAQMKSLDKKIPLSTNVSKLDAHDRAFSYNVAVNNSNTYPQIETKRLDITPPGRDSSPVWCECCFISHDLEFTLSMEMSAKKLEKSSFRLSGFFTGQVILNSTNVSATNQAFSIPLFKKPLVIRTIEIPGLMDIGGFVDVKVGMVSSLDAGKSTSMGFQIANEWDIEMPSIGPDSTPFYNFRPIRNEWLGPYNKEAKSPPATFTFDVDPVINGIVGYTDNRVVKIGLNLKMNSTVDCRRGFTETALFFESRLDFNIILFTLNFSQLIYDLPRFEAGHVKCMNKIDLSLLC